ncbi:MAG: arginine--tRNA ligase [Bacteroidia bacterium]|nr:arginine--tRNA ligase [Bacteroidia bacterium]
MNRLQVLQSAIAKAIQSEFDLEIGSEDLTITPTRKEFEGDYTLVTFPLIPKLKSNPAAIGKKLGEHLMAVNDFVTNYNVIKGFLNLNLSNLYWHQVLGDIALADKYGYQPSNGQKVLVEYSSPNTNKPLHMGHIRNILLGWSCSKILEASGYEVIKTQIVNDRGIAICKSMLAWQKFGEGVTPETAGIKSDHFVGKYYVLFETKFQEEYKVWQESAEGQSYLSQNRKEGQSDQDFFKAYKNTYFNENSNLGKNARDMLISWENGDNDVRAIWKQMNEWVYSGFDQTYERLGVSFDKLYYESETYLLGKDQIADGLGKGVFYKENDGSVWIDMEDAKLDKKIVLRSDGTSVYMTQDIGTAELRYKDFGVDKMIYVVADEQNYHFKSLFEILKRLEAPYAAGLHHLSYGMIDLPTGKMKSREGTVVDADDLIEEVIEEARKSAIESGMLSDLVKEQQEEIFRIVGLGALKFFIIKVNPQKRMTFDPKQSVDMQGQTGPYIQNAYVRIMSILNKIDFRVEKNIHGYEISGVEKDLVMKLSEFPSVVLEAARTFEPSEVANYCFVLSKGFHRFYHDFPIIKAESEEAKAFRIMLITLISKVLKEGMFLLGVEMPDRM